ncbi:MAG: hypothetical protein ACRDGL_05150, partial [Candidatus Limnocylindrales bacterium]
MAPPDPDPHAPHPWQVWLTERATDPEGPEVVPYEEARPGGPMRPGETARPEARPLPWSPPARPRIRTVGELTRIVRDHLRGAPELRDVWVEGEVALPGRLEAVHVQLVGALALEHVHPAMGH